MKRIIFSLFLTIIPLMATANDIDISESTTKLDSLIKTIKEKYIPDTRESVYDISYIVRNDSILLSGATTNGYAYKELESEAKKTPKVTLDRLITLPDAQLKDTLYGVINVSVADIRTQNRFTSGMATQTLLGTPIKILEKKGWYRIQMPDTYFGWAHERQIVPMTKTEFNKWIIAPKIIYTNHYGFAYTNPNNEGEIVSDLVAGDILRFGGVDGDYFKVIYPDKREGYILRKESQEFAIWQQSRKPSAKNFTKTAKTMIGIPYAWGGTSTKGMDCSGLVSTVMLSQGLTILRDASQQATLGKTIDINNGYENLEEGDLMFFGTENNIRHVGFYLGNKKFIHASGWTRISSLDPEDKDYDELNTNEFVKATRIVDKDGTYGVTKFKDNSFYQVQK